MITRRATLLASAALPLAASTFTRPAAAQQPSTLRIAMTVADIPATDGAPDQGTGCVVQGVGNGHVAILRARRPAAA